MQIIVAQPVLYVTAIATTTIGPISGKNHPDVHARCIFSRILIGALPLEGQLPRPK
jgi:hypothetical protein